MIVKVAVKKKKILLGVKKVSLLKNYQLINLVVIIVVKIVVAVIVVVAAVVEN